MGGRGGDVYIVTSLADGGEGSLRHGLDTAAGPRTIVFDVAGDIHLERPLRFSASHLTLAGQTSPGGVTLRGYPVEIVNSAHVVVRYLRFRPGDENAAGVPGKPGRGNADLVGDAADALTVIGSEYVVIDHVSASWSMDETLSVTKSANVTVQYSISARPSTTPSTRRASTAAGPWYAAPASAATLSGAISGRTTSGVCPPSAGSRTRPHRARKARAWTSTWSTM